MSNSAIHGCELRRRNEFGSWVQSVQYEPRLEDDGKALTCSLAAGSKGAEDSITMRMLMNTMEGKAWKFFFFIFTRQM